MRAATEAATVLRAGLGCGNGPVDPVKACSALGYRLKMDHLAADSDGQVALLIPSRRARFAVVVDPRLAAREAWMAVGVSTDERLAIRHSTLGFRVGHELGHTLFYDDRTPPRRLREFSGREEQFCDAFARALLLPRDLQTPTTAHGIATLARGRRVSLEIAASYVADRRPDHDVLCGLQVGTKDDSCVVQYASGGMDPANERLTWADLVELSRSWNPTASSWWSDRRRFVVTVTKATWRNAA